MAKKKIPMIELQSFDDVDFNKSPDIEAAKIIVEQTPSSVEETTKEEEVPEKVAPKAKEQPKEKKEVKAAPKAKASAASTPIKAKPKKAAATTPVKQTAKGTFPPKDKKRASFNIDKDLHRALKDYCYYNDIQMVEYVFEELVRKDLSKRGYYPPKKRK